MAQDQTTYGVTLPRLDRIAISPKLRDHVLVTLWFITTFKQFRFDELLLYPLALYFAWAFVRDFPVLLDLILRSFVLFLFPTWYLLSVFWGVETALILRSGLQILLTIMICYCVVLRLQPRDVMLSFLIAGTLFAVLSFMAGLGGGYGRVRGVFASKNAMGTAMVLLWIAALCTTLDKALPRSVRVFGLGAALLALFQAVMADSATAILLIAGATLIIFTLGVIAPSGAFRRAGFYVVIFVSLALVFLGLVPLLSASQVDPIGAVLGLFGKDTTLTGRTVLWDYAMVEIRQRPWLGIGEGGFWRPLDPLSVSRKIYIEFHKTFYSYFSFHNSYFEIAVHQGLIGLGLTLIFVIWAFGNVARAVVQNLTLPTVFFFCMSTVTLVRSMTESGLMSAFALLPTTFIIGALFEVRRRQQIRHRHYYASLQARNGPGADR
ncbi:MAG: O-antigen ligase family protein [Marinibacterium sp.]|nr:O-antigen ligase family protein [Marinibacterium sp.]